MTGKTVGQYRVLEKIGAGGMGEVYRALDTRLERLVALKFLPEEISRDPVAVERFRREARAASALNHPHICTIHDVGEQDGRHYIVMELLQGQTLRERLNGGPLPVSDALEFAEHTADALQAAHEKGIVHRDLKPANLFITDRGQVKILDFGLAKLGPEHPAETVAADAVTAQGPLTHPGSAIGTAAYMSPEQARGDELDARTDLFSFGAVLHEMVTGQQAFAGRTSAVIFNAILERTPPPAATLRAGVPPELDRLISKALEKDRDLRYHSAAEIRADLRRLRRGESSTTAVTAAAPTRRPRLLAWTALALGAVLIAALVFWRLRPPAEPILSVAVLPFATPAGDASLEFLGDGFAEVLINDLTQVPDLKVIARPTAFTYKGRSLDPRQVGKELNVRAIVTGRLVKRDGQMTVQVDLVDARDGSEIWGGQFQRAATEMAALQSDVVHEITSRLKLRLSDRQQQRLRKQYSANSDAYQDYLRGRFELMSYSERGFRNAIDHFQRAVTRDPGFALGLAGLADAYAYLAVMDMRPPREVMPQARDAALKALRIDPDLGEAYTSLGIVKSTFDWDFPGAEADYRRAMALNPGDSFGRHWYAHYLEMVGRLDAAIVEMRQIVDLDPLSPMFAGDLAIEYRMKRQPQRVLELLKPWEQKQHAFPLVIIGVAHAELGGRKEALAFLDRACPAADDNVSRSYCGAFYGKLGEKTRAMKVLSTMKAAGYVPAAYVGFIHLGLGDKERALEYLEKSVDERSSLLLFSHDDPLLDPLRADARFQRLLQRMGAPNVTTR